MPNYRLTIQYDGGRYRRWLILIVICLVLFLCLIHKNSKGELLFALDKDEILIDYTIDETLAYTLINKNGPNEYGDFFVVFERENDGWNRLYENDFKELMPWKLEVADIDGDDIPEILTAVQKTTYYDKEIKNRMFIFNYNDEILTKKWTGSQIAGSWREFYPMDLLSAPGHELVFIEYVEEDMERISIYSWFDFGFFRIAESDAYPRIQNLNMIGANLLQINYYDGDQERNINLTCIEGEMIPIKDD